MTDKKLISLEDAVSAFSEKVKNVNPDDIWEYEPVDVVQYIEDPMYMDFKWNPSTGLGCRPCVMDDLVEFFGTDKYTIAPRKRVFLDSEGVGTGKTTKGAIICTYPASQILKLRNPIQHFNSLGAQLKPNSKIAITVNARTEANAKEIGYDKVMSFVMHSQWFQDHYLPAPEVTSQLEFDAMPRNPFKFDPTHLYKNVHIVPGGSSEYSVLGYDIFIAIIDEITKFESAHDRTMVDSSTDQAEIIFSAIQGRVVSRFKNLGSVVCFGNPEHSDDFLERHSRKQKDNPNTMIVQRRATWHSSTPYFNPEKDPCFYFSLEKQRIISEKFKNQPGVIPCPYGQDDMFYEIASTRPEVFMRDYCGYPTSAVGQYAVDLTLIERNWDETRKNPMKSGNQPDDPQKYLEEWFKPLHLAWHTIHFDLGEVGDPATFCLSHPFGFTERKSPIIYVDLIYRYQGTPTSPFKIRWMKDWVKELVKRGFPINLMTADTHQSKDLLQTMELYGFMAEDLSLDRNRQPYDHLVQCYMEERIKCPRYQPLSNEYKGLERKGDKIIKSRYGTDDVIQAVAGSVYNCMRIHELRIDPPEEGELIGDFDFDDEDTSSSNAIVL